MRIALIGIVIEIQEINDIEELASYRLMWQSWLADTPRATFFHTWDWLDVYWRHFGRDQKLRALLARSAGTPIGILPLCVRTEQRRLGRGPGGCTLAPVLSVHHLDLDGGPRFSASALSKEPPTDPVDGEIPASASRWVNRSAVY